MAVAYSRPIQHIYYQVTTTNKSFLETCNYLKDTGRVNYKFPLTLIDPDLAGVDPYDPRLNPMMKAKILKECMTNFWYFVREVVRIPNPGVASGIKFGLHRGNLAMYFCLLLNMNLFVDLPRQTGKTIGGLVWYLWLFNFAASNSEISFLNKKFEDSKDNLKRIRDLRDLLPSYLRMDSSFGPDGSKVKGKNNVETLQHPLNRNRIRTVASARNKQAAASLMRGRTTNLIYIDEFGFIIYNNIIYTNMVPAYKTAADNAKRNGIPYGMMITTTPGMLTTDEGLYAFNFKERATPFTELWYDLSLEQLNEIVASNTNSNFVYIRYTYQQVGKSEQWFKDICIEMQKDWDSIRREVLLEWSESSANSPFRKEDLDTIRGLVRLPKRSILLQNKYTFNIYEELQNVQKYPPLIGVDVAGGYQKDSSAITIVDSYSTRVTADMNCNFISTPELALVIHDIVSTWMPTAVVNIERNGGFGASVLAKLVHTKIKRNLFYTIKDRVIEERVMGVNISRKKQKTKVYGSDSTGAERELLMEILRDRVEYHKDKIISPILYEELKTLEVKKNGRIEHSGTGHDDQIFSWLWALYIYYNGNNLMSDWGITKRVLRTDADLEEAVFDIRDENEEITEDLDILDNEEVQSQLEMIKNAPGAKLYNDWVKEEIAKDEEAMAKILLNKIGKQAYDTQFHVDTTNELSNDAFFTMPQSVFDVNNAEDDSMPNSKYNRWPV